MNALPRRDTNRNVLIATPKELLAYLDRMIAGGGVRVFSVMAIYDNGHEINNELGLIEPRVVDALRAAIDQVYAERLRGRNDIRGMVGKHEERSH